MKVVNVLSKVRRAASRETAFSLIEIMVVVALLSVIILGLMAMFTQTQRAFRLGMTQTDVLESGRIASDIIARELSQITPSYFDRGQAAPSFYMGHISVDDQSLPGVSKVGKAPPGGISRSNILQDLYFVTRENQTWTGIGYFVRSNPSNNTIAPVASLYRFQVTNSNASYLKKPSAMFQ